MHLMPSAPMASAVSTCFSRAGDALLTDKMTPASPKASMAATAVPTGTKNASAPPAAAFRMVAAASSSPGSGLSMKEPWSMATMTARPSSLKMRRMRRITPACDIGATPPLRARPSAPPPACPLRPVNICSRIRPVHPAL